MKRSLILLIVALFAALGARAKTLEITIPNVRNNSGNILVMATTPQNEQPVYATAAARQGSVVVRIEVGEATKATVSLFHDQDSDNQMAMGDRGPKEGYARKVCNCSAAEPKTEILLTYPAQSE